MKKEVHYFALKWLNKFNDKDVNYLELVDKEFSDDCDKLGFLMDCGTSFIEIYGDSFDKTYELENIVENINDINILGNAIYSKWRYYNHWAYDSSRILETLNRKWFILVLNRLLKLTENCDN